MKHYENLLLAKRDELAREMGQREGITIERNSDALDDVQSFLDREFVVSNLDRNWTTLKNVDLALNRVKSGDYGICLRCEEEISKKRLNAIPWSRYCITCQEREDARQEEHPDLVVADAA